MNQDQFEKLPYGGTLCKQCLDVLTTESEIIAHHCQPRLRRTKPNNRTIAQKLKQRFDYWRFKSWLKNRNK